MSFLFVSHFVVVVILHFNFFKCKETNLTAKCIPCPNHFIAIFKRFIPIENQFNSFFGPKKSYENFIHLNLINAICLEKKKKPQNCWFARVSAKFVIFIFSRKNLDSEISLIFLSHFVNFKAWFFLKTTNLKSPILYFEMVEWVVLAINICFE